MRNEIIGMQFQEERALYHLQKANITDCVFAGPADGESALKEARDVKLENCSFSLRYPLWHAQTFQLHDSKLDDGCRAAIWYACDGTITDSDLGGIKALRECSRISLRDCRINSPEFGWRCRDITLEDCSMEGEYLFLNGGNLTLENVQLQGKYSFQYVDGLTIRNSVLDTKDAFWHSRNVTVVDSVVKGEYLGWFAENLTLENCRIIGTQPLYGCKNLILRNCRMENCDLAFEYSDVLASIIGHVDSIRNPRSGLITADSVGDVILENAVVECTGKVHIR